MTPMTKYRVRKLCWHIRHRSVFSDGVTNAVDGFMDAVDDDASVIEGNKDGSVYRRMRSQCCVYWFPWICIEELTTGYRQEDEASSWASHNSFKSVSISSSSTLSSKDGDMMQSKIF